MKWHYTFSCAPQWSDQKYYFKTFNFIANTEMDLLSSSECSWYTAAIFAIITQNRVHLGKEQPWESLNDIWSDRWRRQGHEHVGYFLWSPKTDKWRTSCLCDDLSEYIFLGTTWNLVALVEIWHAIDPGFAWEIWLHTHERMSCSVTEIKRLDQEDVIASKYPFGWICSLIGSKKDDSLRPCRLNSKERRPLLRDADFAYHSFQPLE